MNITKRITVSDDQDILEVGATRDELVKYLKECTTTEYAAEVLAWYDQDNPAPTFSISNGTYSIDIWKIQ